MPAGEFTERAANDPTKVTSRVVGVESLGPESTGRWLIRSRGTTHVIDLDASVYERRPGPTSQAFEYDNEPVTLTRVEAWPIVGGRMLIWFDDPHHPELLEHWRMCSHIRSITAEPAMPSSTSDTERVR